MNKPKFGIVVFPGSNCDHDAHNVLKCVEHQDVKYMWHKNSSIGDRNIVILPGGFSYGDYLRCGAISRFSPIMEDVRKFAQKGGTVLGICNGFQILCEAGLLPGALLRNANLKFVCKNVPLTIENKKTIFTSSYGTNGSCEEISLPVAHADGNYMCDKDTLKSLEDNQQIIFRYKENPNGSLADIAGITNKQGNVLGMMPHPERASEDILGGHDGKYLFESIINNLT